MTYLTDSEFTTRGIAGSSRPFARMLGGLLGALNVRRGAAPPPPRPIGPAAEAMIDADYERMAGFGSWEALRDNLRASATAPATKAA